MALFSDKKLLEISPSYGPISEEPLLQDVDAQMAALDIANRSDGQSLASSSNETAVLAQHSIPAKRKFPRPTKHLVTILLALVVISTLGYNWATQRFWSSAGLNTNLNTHTNQLPAVTPMAQIPVSAEGAAEQKRMEAVQDFSKALATCVQTQTQKTYDAPCDSVADLVQNQYLSDNQADIQMAVSDDKQKAIAFIKLSALSLSCESGTGSGRYFVYRSATHSYQVECVDGVPTP